MFDISGVEMSPLPQVAPPEEVLDYLVDDRPGGNAEPVCWSEYLPDGMLADLLANPADTDPEHGEFEVLERVGGWERVIAWAQARQARDITLFMRRAQARNRVLGACDSQAHDSAVAEVGLMLRVSAGTAAGRVGDAWSLCTRLPPTLAALEAGRVTLAKARIIDTETMNLSDQHTALVEQQVLSKARAQTPGQVRAATRRAVVAANPAAAAHRAEQARRERGVRMWPEPDGMATVSAYLPAADAVGVFAVLDEHARHAGSPDDQRSMAARRGDALVDLVLNPTGYRSQATVATREHTDPPARTDQHTTSHAETTSSNHRDNKNASSGGYGQRSGATSTAGCLCTCGRCRRGGGVDVRVTIPYTALLGANDQPGDIAGYGPVPDLLK